MQPADRGNSPIDLLGPATLFDAGDVLLTQLSGTLGARTPFAIHNEPFLGLWATAAHRLAIQSALRGTHCGNHCRSAGDWRSWALA
ncbi:MAG: hypothetical protein WBW25_04820 [Halobacteriota archaeon]